MEGSTGSARTRSAESIANEQSASPTPNRAAGTRRRLSPAQQQEVARIYGSTATSVADISNHFGIGESSVYRMVQLHGVPLRGRPARSASEGTALDGTSSTAPTPTHARQRRGGGRASSPASRRPGRRQSSARGARSARGNPTGVETPARVAALARFRISFSSVQSVNAADVHDAIRQVEVLGATEITTLERVD